MANSATRLWAVNRDGTVRWEHDAGVSTTLGPPVIGVDGTIYLSGPFSTDAGRGVVSIDPGSGTVQSRFDSRTAIPGSPLTISHNLSLLRWGQVVAPGVVLSSSLQWSSVAREVLDVDPGIQSPVISTDDGAVYAVIRSSLTWSSVRWSDIRPLSWEFSLVPPGDSGTGLQSLNFPVILGDGTVAATSGAGAVLRAVTPEGDEKWRFIEANPRQSKMAVGPDGSIYIADLGIKAFDGPKPQTRRTWGQYRADLRRSCRLANPTTEAVLDDLRVLPDGSRAIFVIGLPDVRYGVQSSEDLQSWSLLGESSSANGCVRFVDDRPSPIARFYRVTP